MASLTKDQLKNALVSHGVELPSTSARKEEYLRLYKEFVAPTEKSKNDFSSDEEDVVHVEENKVNMNSFIVDGFDVSTLSDDDLFKRLQEHGATVGPIVDSTRKVYQRKLVVLMGGDVVDSPPAYNGDVNDDDEYSDNEVEEEVEVIEEPVRTHSSSRAGTTMVTPSPSKNIDLRKRVFASPDERPKGDAVFDPDRHTPSPRPSLRSVTSTTTTTTSSTKDIKILKYINNGGRMTNATSPEEDEQDRHSKISLVVRLIVKLLFLALIIALIYYVYQNDPSESPFKAVEQMAKQVLEAAVGEEAKAPAGEVTGEELPPPEAVPAV